FAYFNRPDPRPDKPAHSWQELLGSSRGIGLGATERAKLLETMLHATPAEGMADLVTHLACPDGGPELLRTLRTLFNETSLTPWTDLTDKSLTLLDELERQQHISTGQTLDFLGSLLCQLSRHLTAYDLVTFHHRGANYPDALLLDAALKALLF